MRKLIYCLFLLFLLTACNDVEKASGVDEVGEAEKKEQVDSTDNDQQTWEGYWGLFNNSEVKGYLYIYNETEDGFYFDIHVAHLHVGSMENIYAKKEGSVAKSVEDEAGCIMTLTLNKSEIITNEGEQCYVYSGMGISLNGTFTKKQNEGTDGILVIDEQFESLVKSGYLVRGSYPIGTKIDTILSEMGLPESIQDYQGADFYIYEVAYGVPIVGDGTVSSIMASEFKINYSPEQIIRYLGPPEYEGESQMDPGYWYINYSYEGKFNLTFEYEMQYYRLLTVSLTKNY